MPIQQNYLDLLEEQFQVYNLEVKKMKYIKLLLLILFLLPLNIFANELDIRYECPEKIKSNEQFTCQVKGVTNLKVSGLEYEFKIPNYLTFINFEKNHTWEGGEENNLIILYGLEDKTNEFILGKMTLLSKETINNVDIETNYLVFSDENYEDHIVIDRKQLDDVKEVKIKEKKDVNKSNKIVVCVIIIIIALTIILLLLKKRRRKKE